MSTDNEIKRRVDAIIFIPFTDGEYGMLIDTIESIEHYVKESYHIIAVDDYSTGRLNEKVQKAKPGITVMRTSQKNGGRSGLYVTMAEACKYALKNFRFEIFMKMDTDALMVGSGLIAEARKYIVLNPRAGILGSYRVRSDGRKRRWNKWKWTFLYESSCIRPYMGKKILWKQILRQAQSQGYDIGENVLGGAYFLSYACIKSMIDSGFLEYDYDAVRYQSNIGDEIIYSLLCRACGFELHDFGTPAHTMALALDMLPLNKEEIVANGKTVIHSVKRGKKGETQDELRQYFKKIRITDKDLTGTHSNIKIR